MSEFKFSGHVPCRACGALMWMYGTCSSCGYDRTKPIQPTDSVKRTKREPVGQTKTHSFVESWINVFIGWVINFCIQLTLFPAMGVPVTISQNLTISAVFTVVSVTRSYLLRRFFNNMTCSHGQKMSNRPCDSGPV